MEGIATITLGEDPQLLENLNCTLTSQLTYQLVSASFRKQTKNTSGYYRGSNWRVREDDIERYEDLYGRNVNKICPTKK